MGVLEDDACDILRKARAGCGMDQESLSRLAGVARDRIVEMEDGGRASDAEWSAVGAVLGLAPAALVDIARERWMPRRPDPAIEAHVVTVASRVGGYEARCHLIGDRPGGPAALFDCGTDADAVVAALKEREWSLERILVTHGHGDHVGALDDIVRRTRPAEVVLPSPEADGRHGTCGPFRIEAAATPGHTADSVSYIVSRDPGKPWACVVGDLLFAGSVGGAGRGLATLLRSIRRVVLTLPDWVAVLPGHGPVTTVGEERRHNPFLASGARLDPERAAWIGGEVRERGRPGNGDADGHRAL